MARYEIPEQWDRITLGELTNSQRPICYGVLKPGPYTEEGIPLVRTCDISSNYFDGSNLHKISNELDSEFSRSRITGGELLISLQGTVGRVAMYPPEFGEANISRTIGIIKPDERALNRFLYWYLRFIGEREEFGTVGSTRASLNIGTLRELEIPHLPLPEQKRIVAILDKADAIRRKRQETLTLTESLIQSTFLDMFGDPSHNPNGLAVSPLGEICDVRDGTHDSPKYVEDGFPLVTTKNLKGGRVDLSDVSLISEADFISINKRSKVDKGDILMPMIGTIGSPVLVEDDPEYAIKNVALIKFLPASPDNRLIQALLSGQYLDRIISKKSRGGTQKFLSLGDIRSIPVPLPPEEAQEKFAQVFEKIKSLQSKELEDMKESDNLFNSLQQRAFRGELSLN